MDANVSEVPIEQESVQVADPIVETSARSADSADTITEADELIDEMPKTEEAIAEHGMTVHKNGDVKLALDEPDGGEELKPEIDSDCRCGKGRNYDVPEFLCGVCGRWFHRYCIDSDCGKCVPFLTNYQFFCKMCSVSKSDALTKKQASFKEMCHCAIANLSYRNPDQKQFSRDREIIPYMDKHWEYLTTMPRRVKQTWHATVGKTLANQADLFTYSEETVGDPLYGLVNPDLSLVGPSYESLKSAMAQAQLKMEQKQLLQTENRTTTRGAKRKAPGEYQMYAGVRQTKKSETQGTTKTPAHGYPLEHPFNKDCYRYHLAESDPHAPNRQAFDESLEWAGKPIPGYLYRLTMPKEVLLSMHDRAGQLKLSDDRLTVTGEKGYSMIRASHGVSRGAWYFEARIVDMPPETAVRIGWSQPVGNLQAPCGYDKFSYSWRSRKGTRFHQSRGKHYSSCFDENDVLGFFISFPPPDDASKLLPAQYKDKPLIKFKSNFYYEEKDNLQELEKTLKPQPGSKIIFFKNGKMQGIAFEDIFEGTYHPAVSVYKAITVKVNFGPKFEREPEGLDYYRPMCERPDEVFVEHALGDMLYHIENEAVPRTVYVPGYAEERETVLKCYSRKSREES